MGNWIAGKIKHAKLKARLAIAVTAAGVAYLRNGELLPNYIDSMYRRHDNGYLTNEFAEARKLDAANLMRAGERGDYEIMKRAFTGSVPDVLAWSTPEGRADQIAQKKMEDEGQKSFEAWKKLFECWGESYIELLFASLISLNLIKRANRSHKKV
jgi:hypothetical protein